MERILRYAVSHTNIRTPLIFNFERLKVVLQIVKF